MKAIRAMFVVLALSSSLTAIDALPLAGEIHRPWCVEYQGGNGDNGTSCAFTSREQCMLTATPGSGGICVQNPWYLESGRGGQQPDTARRGERTRR